MNCNSCGSEMSQFQGGVSKAGKEYGPSWRCPNQCEGSIRWIKTAQRGQQGASQGGNGGGGQSGAGSRSQGNSGGFRGKSPEETRSIVAQVALKAAVELACSRPDMTLALIMGAASDFNRHILEMASGRQAVAQQQDDEAPWEH